MENTARKGVGGWRWLWELSMDHSKSGHKHTDSQSGQKPHQSSGPGRKTQRKPSEEDTSHRAEAPPPQEGLGWTEWHSGALTGRCP